MIVSGRCHGPGCQQAARVEFWCGESCKAAWDKSFAAPRETVALPVEDDPESTVRPLHVAIVGDTAERLSGPIPDLGATPFTEAAHNMAEALGGISTAGMAVAACGIGQTLAHSAELERLTLVLREVCPPERFDEAMADVEDLMDTTWMPRAEALERVISYGRFATASATYPLVASENPQVAHSGMRGWLGRWLHRMRGAS